MPTIPSYLAKEPLPTTTGVQGGIAAVPVVGQSGAQDIGPSALERQLGAVPTSLIQSGTLLQHAEELRAHQQKAQDLLDAKTRRQDTRPQLYTLLDTLRQGPYQTLPEELLTQGNALITEQAKSLSPQARALFLEEAKGDLVPLHAAALQERSQRRDESTIQAVMTEAHWFQEQYQQAGSDFERAYHKESLSNLLTSFTEAGLVKGAVASKILADTEDGLALTNAQNATRLDPAASLHDIHARMSGGVAQNPALQQAPAEKLPALFDDATQRLHAKVVLHDHEDARAKRQLQEQQSRTAGEYHSIVFSPGITIPTLMGLLDPIQKDWDLQRLGEADHRQLLSHIQTLMGQLREDAYKDRDVPPIAQAGRIRIETAQTPGELATAQQWVYANTTNLSTHTTQSMLARITERGDHNDPTNDSLVQEAQKLFLSGAFPGGIVPAVMDKIDGGIQAKTSEGLDVLKQEVRRIYETDGRDAMRAQAMEIGRKLKDLYFPSGPSQQGPLPSGMPPAFQGVTTFEDGLLVLDALDVNQAAKRRLYLQLKESLPRRSPLTGVPQGTGLDKVQGVSKPKTPYPTMEQR